MPIYGKLTAASPEQFEADLEHERRTVGGVYGTLVVDAAPVAPAASADAPAADASPATPLVATPLGADYTVADLQAAIQGDPALVDTMALTEVARTQGPRKGALQFLALQKLSPDVAKLVADALDALGRK